MRIICGVGKQTSPRQIMGDLNILLVEPINLNQCVTVKETKPGTQYVRSLLQYRKNLASAALIFFKQL